MGNKLQMSITNNSINFKASMFNIPHFMKKKLTQNKNKAKKKTSVEMMGSKQESCVFVSCRELNSEAQQVGASEEC